MKTLKLCNLETLKPEPFMNSLSSRTFLMLAALLLCSCAAFSQQVSEKQSSSDRDAIAKVLLAQQDAWNRGDLAGFMSGYWNSPDLTFFSGAQEHDGWQSALDRYKQAYASPGHSMGKLDFAALRIETLSPNAAFVRGQWHLTMPDGSTPHGLFTLIFRKFPDGWKIVHDHTSAE